jgi:hypothetical protein
MICHICGIEIDSLISNEYICRKCIRERWSRCRKTRKEEGRLSENSWSYEKKKQYAKEYGVKNKERLKEIKAKYIEKYPMPRKATYTLNNALKRNEIIKTPCVVCGSKIVEAHHEDYNKPLDVVWYCKKHHVELHKNKRKQNLKTPL